MLMTEFSKNKKQILCLLNFCPERRALLLIFNHLILSPSISEPLSQKFKSAVFSGVWSLHWKCYRVFEFEIKSFVGLHLSGENIHGVVMEAWFLITLNTQTSEDNWHVTRQRSSSFHRWRIKDLRSSSQAHLQNISWVLYCIKYTHTDRQRSQITSSKAPVGTKKTSKSWFQLYIKQGDRHVALS